MVVPYTSFLWVRYHPSHVLCWSHREELVAVQVGGWIQHIYPFRKYTQYKLHSQPPAGLGEKLKGTVFFFAPLFNKSVMTLRCYSLHSFAVSLAPYDIAPAASEISKILFWINNRFVFQERGTFNCVKAMPNKAFQKSKFYSETETAGSMHQMLPVCWGK